MQACSKANYKEKRLNRLMLKLKEKERMRGLSRLVLKPTLQANSTNRGPDGLVLKLTKGRGAEAGLFQGYQQLPRRCSGAGTKRGADARAPDGPSP